jgi:hypothetical protein
MFLLLTALAHAEPVVLDLAPPPQPPRSIAGPLLADLLIGIGQAASPYQITGPTQDGAASAWQCLGVDNATLDIAGRCPFTAMTRRLPRD